MRKFMVVLDSSTECLNAMRFAAMRAAKTGIEYGAYQALTTTTCNTASGVTLATLNTLSNALSGFTVVVTCSASQHTEVGIATPYFVYTITSVATFGSFGDNNYATRQLEAKFTSDNII